ncbi:EAL domain-containing protein [Xanthomonas sacchari]|uniref:EAL domain-containing protein n=2 Tax=Xanthomonas TaxID=338 RepID=UPI00225DF435|nr:EAL domain-containing protein [Xanthomonas sacchari]MCW0425858.1 putative cyclic di-GMP phosphodiesterase PdeA [Xanthomonas sacchari]
MDNECCGHRAMRRRDVWAAADLLSALRGGRLLLAFQPVISLGRDGAQGAVLYDEALLRLGEGGGVHAGVVACAEGVGALERLGWVERLDFSVLEAIIELLQQVPEVCLGCNVSAASLREGPGWTSVLTQLGHHPDVARRLTLEITETSTITHGGEVMTLVAALRECGVRIAIDDLGAGFTTFEFLARCQPDVVKIDRSVLLRACEPQAPAHLLRNLVQMCADHSGCVVVEGIETTAQWEAACAAGAHAVQGYLIASPVVQPLWLERPPVVVQEVLDAQIRRRRSAGRAFV